MKISRQTPNDLLSLHPLPIRISICTEYMDGGSLDSYGAIPEHVLGRIIVGVNNNNNKIMTIT